jgi:hypothetical protein
LFPDLRYGAELYKSLPHSLELSAGFRTLKYSTTTFYTKLVGTPAIVIGHCVLILPEMEEQAHQQPSIIVNIEVTANFMSFTFSMGVSPEVNQFIFSATDAAIINLKTQRLNASYFYYIKK